MPQDRMTLKKVAKWLAWSMIAMAAIVLHGLGDIA
jgi:hypothetical protein